MVPAGRFHSDCSGQDCSAVSGRKSLSGVLLVLVSAAAFGAMPIFIKIAYAAGAEPVAMLALRFTIASLLMSGWMFARKEAWPRGRTLLVLIGMGALGYVGQSFCFFSALNYASAGLVSLLLYLYPALVTFLGALFFRERLRPWQMGAVLAALAGTALIIGGDSHGSLTGVALGIGAALIYSLYILVGSRVLHSTGALATATTIMLAAAVVFTMLAVINRPALPMAWSGWLAIAAIALISTVVAMVTFFAGLARLGAADAATVSTFEPVVTVVLAAVFLGEPLSWAKMLGGGIILGALLVLARSK